MSDDQNLVNDDGMDDDLETNKGTTDELSDMLEDDSLVDDSDSVKATRSPLLDLEEDAALDADFSEPKGLENSDPGVNDEATLDATMWHKGVDDNLEEEDIEALGFHVEDGTSGGVTEEVALEDDI